MHHCHSIRLKGYDYSSPGVCFLTICAFNRECLFGQVVVEQMRLTGIPTIIVFLGS